MFCKTSHQQIFQSVIYIDIYVLCFGKRLSKKAAYSYEYLEITSKTGS